jgi:hypothetical protein
MSNQGYKQQLRIAFGPNELISLEHAELIGFSQTVEPVRMEGLGGAKLATRAEAVEFGLVLHMDRGEHVQAVARLTEWWNAIREGTPMFLQNTTYHLLKGEACLTTTWPNGKKLKSELTGVVLRGWKIGAFKVGDEAVVTALCSADGWRST